MQFSLTYQNFRLLDVKALTECYLYTMSQPSGSKQSQAVDSVQDFQNLCRILYNFFRMLSLGCFYSLFTMITTGKYAVADSGGSFGSTLEIDLKDYLYFIKTICEKPYSLEDEEQFKHSIDNRNINGVLEFTVSIKELCNSKPSEFFAMLHNSDYTNAALAVSDELRVHLQNAYEEIIFNGVSVLRIYAEQVTSIFETIRNSVKIKIKDTFDNSFQQACLDAIASLNFDQEKNWSTVYASYIISVCTQKQKTAIITRYNELSCGGVSALSNSEGDAVYTIDKPAASSIIVNNTPEVSLKPGALLYQVNKIEKDCKLISHRKSEVLSNLLNVYDFRYSARAGHKYLIKSTMANSTFWTYNQHNLKEPTFPLYSIVSDVVAPELETKVSRLNAVFKEEYKFKVCMPGYVCILSELKETDNTCVAKQKANSISRIVCSILNSIPNYLTADLNMQNLGITDIFQYDTYVKVINELLILDANLKSAHSSLSKFWSVYLAANFNRNKAATLEISDAAVYTDKYTVYDEDEQADTDLVYPYTKNNIANFTTLLNAITTNDNYMQLDTTMSSSMESIFSYGVSVFNHTTDVYGDLLASLDSWKAFANDAMTITDLVNGLLILYNLTTENSSTAKEVLLYSLIVLTLTRKSLQYLAEAFCEIFKLPAESITSTNIFSFCLKTLFNILNSKSRKDQLYLIFLLLYSNKEQIDFCCKDNLSLNDVKSMDISTFLETSSLKTDINDIKYNLAYICEFLELNKLKYLLSLAEIQSDNDNIDLKLMLLKFNKDKKIKLHAKVEPLNLEEAVNNLEMLLADPGMATSLIDEVDSVFSRPGTKFDFDNHSLFTYMVYSIYQFKMVITEPNFKNYINSDINKALYTKMSYRPNIHIRQEEDVFDELIQNLAYVLREYDDISNYIRTQLSEPQVMDLCNIKSARTYAELDDKYSLFGLSRDLDDEGYRKLEFITVNLADISVNYYLHSSGVYVCGSRVAVSYEDNVNILTEKVRQFSRRDIETGIVITKETLYMLE